MGCGSSTNNQTQIEDKKEASKKEQAIPEPGTEPDYESNEGEESESEDESEDLQEEFVVEDHAAADAAALASVLAVRNLYTESEQEQQGKAISRRHSTVANWTRTVSNRSLPGYKPVLNPIEHPAAPSIAE
jgi:hypothetical protein